MFDLDGTLANTQHLEFRQRRPAVLLEPDVGAPPTQRWSNGVSHLPAQLLAKGYRVGVVTRAPQAYAWTLVWLLGIDFETMLAGRGEVGSDPGPKLRLLAQEWHIDTGEILYIGDTEDDQKAARAFGARFAWPWWRKDLPQVGGTRPDFPRVRRPLPATLTSAKLQDTAVADRDHTPHTLIDDAVGRLRAGTATATDYDLLDDRRLHSLLVEHGDPDRLRPALRDLAAPGAVLPWADPTVDSVWEEVRSTGDANRLLDMDPVPLMLRLPDPALEASLERLAAAGGRRVVADTLRGLDPLIAARIKAPDPPQRPSDALRSDLRGLAGPNPRTAELATSPVIDSQERLRIAIGTLAADPGSPARRELQQIVLSLLPRDAAECLLIPPELWPPRHSCGLPPWLINRAEYETDPELRHTVFEAMRRWFPRHPIGTASFACVSYYYPQDGWGAGVWRLAKDYQGKAAGSGPNVMLQFLELPALALAAHVAAAAFEQVIAVPSTSFNEKQPAVASERLAERVAELAGIEFAPILTKDDHGRPVVEASRHSDVSDTTTVLVDDQITSGASLRDARAALASAGVRAVTGLAWSASAIKQRWDARHQLGECWAQSIRDGVAALPRLQCWNG